MGICLEYQYFEITQAGKSEIDLIQTSLNQHCKQHGTYVNTLWLPQIRCGVNVLMFGVSFRLILSR